jgi:hypothetical protein
MLRLEEISVYGSRLSFEVFLVAGEVAELCLYSADKTSVSLQARDFGASGLIKYAYSFVRTATDDPTSVELHTRNALAVSRKGPYASACPHVPNLDTPVTRCRNDVTFQDLDGIHSCAMRLYGTSGFTYKCWLSTYSCMLIMYEGNLAADFWVDDGYVSSVGMISVRFQTLMVLSFEQVTR